MDNRKLLDSGDFVCDIDGKTYVFHPIGSYALHERTSMKTFLHLVGMILLIGSIFLILSGCGDHKDERASAPSIGVVSVAQNQQELECRAAVSAGSATASFSTGLSVTMADGVARTPITSAMYGQQVFCTVSASYRDSGITTRRSDSGVLVSYAPTYNPCTYNCGGNNYGPYQQPRRQCDTTYVDVWGITYYDQDCMR